MLAGQSHEWLSTSGASSASCPGNRPSLAVGPETVMPAAAAAADASTVGHKVDAVVGMSRPAGTGDKGRTDVGVGVAVEAVDPVYATSFLEPHPAKPVITTTANKTVDFVIAVPNFLVRLQLVLPVFCVDSTKDAVGRSPSQTWDY